MSGYDLLARSLDACGRDGATGGLRVSGAPGGVLHLRDGLVVAAESPGAPGPEALLLRSGRVDGEQWAALLREAGGARWPAAGLIAHGYAGAAELRVVCLMALQDAAFAITAGRVDGCERADGCEPPSARVEPGETPARLLRDADRKRAAVAALPHPVHPDRERPRPAAHPPRPLTDLQRELLAHADGRRTARDLAFRTGRGVYTVTVEIARMLADGLLECPAAPATIVVHAPPGPIRHRTPPPRPAAVPPAPLGLPRRSPGASGITGSLPPPRQPPGWKGLFRLRGGTPG
ncbi:MarR family transcriptional regulator [Streptomyces sp. NPDC101249]|uniref:MarR family transcriptional regulator n=1 Tax=Streptomyces sp. NPDC101249 TaxID=3366140 RepID=UPI00382C0A63